MRKYPDLPIESHSLTMTQAGPTRRDIDAEC